MNDIALDPTTGDLAMNGLDLFVIQGADSVRQQLDLKLSLWTGDWFLDTEFGTPYLESVLGKRVTLNAAVAALKTSILEVSEVSQITRFDHGFDRKLRVFQVNFECSTTYGLIRVAPKKKAFESFDYTTEESINILVNETIPSHGY